MISAKLELLQIFISGVRLRQKPMTAALEHGHGLYLCSICSCIGNVSFCALVLKIVSVDLESEPIPFYRFSSVGPLVDPFHQVTANLG